MTATAQEAVREARTPRSARRHDVAAVLRVELVKLAAQARVRLALGVCVLGPVAFAVLVRLTGTLPADTVFGRQAADSAAAVALVVLGFAGSWGLPLLVALVAGDVVSGEDHHGTWTTLLTRSRPVSAVLAGKAAAAALYAVTAVVVLAAAALVAGLLGARGADLLGLSGQRIGAGSALALTAAAWASVLPAALAFGALGLLVSVLTRHSVAGIAAPVVLGLLGQLLTLVDGAQPFAAALPSASFLAWHGLFTDPSWSGPLLRGIVVGLVWTAVFTVAATVAARRRWSRGR